MAAPSGKYIPPMVQEFYAFYAAMLKMETPAKAKELDQPPLLTTLVCEISVELLKETVVYRPTYKQTTPTDKYDHHMQIFRHQNVMKDPI